VELLGQIRPGDIALLHDPQAAGLAEPLARAGARVVWRCHIGVGWENDATRAGWGFLRPHLASAEGFVFSRREYVPSWIPDEKVSVIPPSIDPSPRKTSSSTPPRCRPSSRESACSTVPGRRCPRGSYAATAT
jgi:trehalose synthase